VKLRTLRDEIETQRQHVRDAASRWLKLSNTEELRRDHESQLTDANFRLKKFEEYGVADKLQKRLGFQQDATALTRMKDRADSFVIALGQLISEHEDDLRNAMSYVSKQNPGFFTAYYAEFANLVAKVDQLKKIEQEARAITARLQAKQGEFDGARQSLQEEFAQVERQLAQELKQTGMTAIQPDDFLTQQQRKTKAEQMLEALAKQETQQSSIRDALFAEIDKLNGLWLREFNAIKAELDRVNAGHTALQIEADFKGDKEAAIGFMQQLFKGSNIRETTLRAVMEDYADFGGLLRDLPNALRKAGSTPEVFEKTFMQNLVEFVTYQVPNRFVIRYRGKELKHHSLGQRASALLLYVLSQRQNDVIIIDQPEDDLDNQTIYDDVIKLLREMKPHAQFIFATHNANFPVLGDAEQVHACRYQDEQVAVQSGSIDARPVQDAIINIMEGRPGGLQPTQRGLQPMETTELIEALSRGEDSRHQFKENFTNADALAAEIVAFSNTAGGQIFIGVQNDGTVLGLSHADIDRLNQLISNSASQNVRPAVNPLTENVPHPNGTVMVVTVAEGVSKPYMDKNGVIWVKNGSDKRRATSREEIQRLFQQAGLVHADETPVAGLGAGDVDLPYFEAFFEQQFGETLAQHTCHCRNY
jgi:hypothetical protein